MVNYPTFSFFYFGIVDEAPTPIIAQDELSRNLTVAFNLPAIPYIPLEVEIVFFKGNDEVGSIDRTTDIESKEIEFSISNSDVPEGNISVGIRVKYQGDDSHGFSKLSEKSNSLGKNCTIKSNFVMFGFFCNCMVWLCLRNVNMPSKFCTVNIDY